MTAMVRSALVGALVASLALASTACQASTRPAHTARRTAAAATAPAVEDVVFDDITLELTADRLTAVLKGFAAANTATAGRAALLTQKQDFLARANALRAEHGKELDAETQQRAGIQSCLDVGYRAVVQAHAAQLRAHAQADAAFQQDMTIRSMELSQAQANGDTAVAKRLQAELAAMVAPTQAESLAAQAKCGVLPPLSSAATQLAVLERQAAAVDAAVHALDGLAEPAALAASGLDENQFATARQRIASYLEHVRGNAPPAGFSAEELAALAARRTELAKAIPAP